MSGPRRFTRNPWAWRLKQLHRPGFIADIQDKLGALYLRLGNKQLGDRCFNQSLSWKMSLGMPFMAYTPHPYWNDIIFRFHDGAPNCLRQFQNGNELLVVTTSGVTVAASLNTRPTDLVKAGQMYVVARNDSQQNVPFLSQSPTHFISLPKATLLHPINPVSLQKSRRKERRKLTG